MSDFVSTRKQALWETFAQRGLLPRLELFLFADRNSDKPRSIRLAEPVSAILQDESNANWSAVNLDDDARRKLAQLGANPTWGTGGKATIYRRTIAEWVSHPVDRMDLSRWTKLFEVLKKADAGGAMTMKLPSTPTWEQWSFDLDVLLGEFKKEARDRVWGSLPERVRRERERADKRRTIGLTDFDPRRSPINVTVWCREIGGLREVTPAAAEPIPPIPVVEPKFVESDSPVTTPPVKPTPVAPPRPPHPLNLILHGPPGTGKTWEMRHMRQAFDLRAEAPPRSPRPDAGDLNWFEVVALALHDLGEPSTAPAINAHPLVQAKNVEQPQGWGVGPTVRAQLQRHTVEASKKVKYAQRTPPLVFDQHPDGRWFFPNGFPDELSEKVGLGPESAPRADAPPDNQFLITFHPSFTYEDFVEGIRPETAESGDETVRYPLRAGIFKRACERAVQLAGFTGGLAAFCDLPVEERRTLLATASPAVLFIDEINRGNVARILGELITLIEPDKRLGGDEELIVTLPGSQARFGVPSNLWIVGTMNTADRSVVALDVALRRRFAFRECPPDPSLLDGIEVYGVDLSELLRRINQRLLVLRDRDHLIGHAFFWPMKADPARRTLGELQRVFRESIVPLLLEYFHDDLGRIGLVLGKAFVTRHTTTTAFADFEHDHKEDLADRPVWTLADPLTLPAEAFRKVYA